MVLLVMSGCVQNIGRKMRELNPIFELKLAQHKKLIYNMCLNEDKSLIVPVSNTAKELALAYSRCKCEKCDSEENLQYHHLIRRTVKHFTDFWKYLAQRYYWANILILCRKHHREAENVIHYSNADNDNQTITKETIAKIKKKYNII